MNKKNKTLTRLEELRAEKAKITKELAFWTAKEQKVNKFSQVLYETRKFTSEHLDANIEKARARVKQWALENKDDFDCYLLEYEIRDKVEFSLYYQGLELFEEKISKDIKHQVKEIQRKLWNIESETEKLAKRETQRELKKQAKESIKTSTLNNHEQKARNQTNNWR